MRAPQGASTPFDYDPFEHAIGPLQFREVLDVVATHARGPLGADRLRARRPRADGLDASNDLCQVGELLLVWARGEAIDVPPVPDIASIVARLRVDGSVLSGVELVGLRQTISAARIAQSELRRIADQAPSIGPLLVALPDKALDRRLSQSLDDEGELLDTASPRLFQARQAIHGARERLVKKLESVIRGADSQTVPQGAQVTVRGDRYVIPVRRDSRTRPEGIIHDESGSQGTLFVEPTAAIEFGNTLRSAIAEAEREALRVLRELTDLARPEVQVIALAHEMCVRGDDLLARVRYAHGARAAIPRLGSDRVVLKEARHPLLLARGIVVEPFDLELAPGQRTLLISGPNAGGKTVLLKTVGLVVLMAQAGIVPPVGPGTALPVFDRAFADIGDHQSIAADLSTFSAHVAMLREILATAGPGTLVLMDEIGSGTDPVEGGALAGASLRALTERGAVTVATTHLGVLKTLATEVPGIINGSLDFDAEALRPTFRFRQGTPGRSYGLAIAKRLGVDPGVLERAEQDVPDRERALDELLGQVEARALSLEVRASGLDGRALDLDSREAKAAVTEEAQGARELELKRREREYERSGRRDARRHLLDARQLVEEALRVAKDAIDPEKATEARRLIEDGAKAETAALDAVDREEARDRPTGAAVAVGRRVRLATGGTGVVHEIRSDGKVVVGLGAMKVIVDSDDAVVLSGAGPERARAVRVDVDLPVGPSEIDLRGMRADEAGSITLAALDAAILSEHPLLRIIHGMGTGAVRDRVRQVLKSDRRVAKFESAPRNQGGAGVTVVEFKDS